MTNISLKSIKYESIKAIINSIAEVDRISRAEISEKTDLSLVTVGKIADALLERNVVTQVKEIRSQAGRRAGLLSINPERFSLILDFTRYEFRCAILNLRLDTLDKFTFQYRPNATYEENVQAFLAETSVNVRRSYDMEQNCIGVGVAVPGPYDAATDRVFTSRIPELADLPLGEIVKRHFRRMPLVIDSHINAAARSNIRHVEDYEHKNIVYWYVSDHFVCGVYVVAGNLILGKNGHACDLGSVRQLTGCTVEKKIAACKDQNEVVDTLGLPVYNLIRALNPHTVILDFCFPFDCDGIIPSLNDALRLQFGMKPEDMPELRRAWCKSHNSHRGLTMSLRELWLNEIVYGPSDGSL